MTKNTPYDWLRQIPPSLLQLDSETAYGYMPSFPWEQYGSELAKALQVEKCTLQPTDYQWRETNDLFSGLGRRLLALNMNIAPLNGTLSWVFPESEMAKLLSLLIAKESNTADAIDKEYKEGFNRFISLEAIYALGKVDFEKGLSPQLQESTALPNSPSFCIDIALTVENTNLAGRVYISQELRKSWQERQAPKVQMQIAASPLSADIPLIVCLEAGSTSLMKSEISRLVAGDFLLLDKCSYEPNSDRKRILMTVNGTPVHRAKIKQGSIKILEFPLYQEVGVPMSRNTNDDDENQDDSLFEDESDFENDEFEDTGFEEEETEAPPLPANNAPSNQKKSPPTPPPGNVKGNESQKIATNDLPMTLIVEVGRIQMSLQKLLELQPGNLLELDIRPEDGVSLVVNGKCVAKGELLRIGEALGVRILEIG
jgi:flagellar motor switch protein FliN/FliY